MHLIELDDLSVRRRGAQIDESRPLSCKLFERPGVASQEIDDGCGVDTVPRQGAQRTIHRGAVCGGGRVSRDDEPMPEGDQICTDRRDCVEEAALVPQIPLLLVLVAPTS